MAYQYTNRFAALTSTSTSTSGPWCAADFQNVTVSWLSSASLGPSRITIEGSLADGLQAADLGSATQTTNWSLVTGINIIGRPNGAEAVVSAVSQHYRWLRATVAPANHSSASATAVTFFGQTW